MADGMQTVRRFPKDVFGKADLDQLAADARAGGATAEVTEDATTFILTVTLPNVPAGGAAPLTAAALTPVVAGAPPDAMPNHALDFATAIIKHWESCSLTVFHGATDRPDVWTIGWGAITIDGSPVKPSTPPITQARADGLLTDAVAHCQTAVRKLVSVVLTEYQEAALISFSYNLGTDAFGGSTLRTMINGGHIAEAAPQFMRWVNSNGKPVKGLVRRRGAEQAVFEGKIPFGPALGNMMDQAGDAALSASSTS